MICQNCNGKGSIVFPEGLNGEAVCSRCGLVVDDGVAAAHGYAEWTPEWFSRWREGDSETLKEWLTVLRIVASQLNLPNFPFREEAARIIRLNSEKLFKCQRFGKNKREAVTALIYLILKQENKMRCLKEMCKSLSVDYRLVNRILWDMNGIVKPRSHAGCNGNSSTGLSISSSIGYLKAYGFNLTGNSEILVAAEKLLESLSKNGGNPVSLAAGALYYACKGKGVKISKKAIAEAFHISSRTVYSNERRIRMLAARNHFSQSGTFALGGFNSIA